MRTSLVRALSAFVCERRRAAARRFLQGLSADELQYIADYFGACILETSAECGGEWNQVSAFARRRQPHAGGEALADHAHKMLVLVEYLARCGVHEISPALRATGQPG